MIYFIKCGHTPYVKIGWSGCEDVKNRLYVLQIGCPFELIIMKTIDGNKDLEDTLHFVFKEYLIRGEWFELNQTLVDFINETPKGVKSETTIKLWDLYHGRFLSRERIKEIVMSNEFIVSAIYQIQCEENLLMNEALESKVLSKL